MILNVPEVELFAKGHRACAGCGAALAMRHILKASGKNTIVAQATGCMEVISTPYPETAWRVPYVHVAFENAAAVASGVDRALKMLGKRDEINVLAIAGDGGCYSDDTEVFTENGFKNIKDIKVGEKIWSVNPETNELELATNEKLHKYQFKGEMIRGKSKFIDFLITPNHNIPIWYKGKWKFIKGYELKTRYKTPFIRKFEWNCQTLETVAIPQIKTHTNQKVFNLFPAKAWLRFLGWYISEGTLYKSKSGYLIRIYQSDKEKRKEILKLIKGDLGIDAFECNRSIDFQSKQIYEYLEKECGKGWKNKHIPKWVLELDKSLLMEIYITLMQGDGSVTTQKTRKNPHLRFSTSSEYLMNNFVELVLKLGMNCRITKRANNNYIIGVSPIYLKHILYSRRKLYEKHGTKQISEEDYDGYVYCPQLDKNHTLIIKRNGKISLNGNTFDIGLQSLSGAIERGDRFCYICYANEGYMNTGVQRSSDTPKYSSTTTSPAGKKMHGKLETQKNMPFIVAAHGCYVATANIAFPQDFVKKIQKALTIKGPSYVQVYTPCPPGWRIDDNMTISISKLAFNAKITPLFEIENGILTISRMPNEIPVKEYLKLQGRFKHLTDAEIDEMQKHVDEEWEKIKKLNETKIRI